MPEASSLSRYFPVVAVTPLSSATAESTVGRTCPHSLPRTRVKRPASIRR